MHPAEWGLRLQWQHSDISPHFRTNYWLHDMGGLLLHQKVLSAFYVGHFTFLFLGTLVHQPTTSQWRGILNLNDLSYGWRNTDGCSFIHVLSYWRCRLLNCHMHKQIHACGTHTNTCTRTCTHTHTHTHTQTHLQRCLEIMRYSFYCHYYYF